MASIFKRGRDKKKKNSFWRISYFDESHKRRTVKGFTDKSQTERLAAKLENDVRLRLTGMIETVEEGMADLRKLDLESHLPEFEKFLRRPGNSNSHVKHVMGRVRSIIEGCDFRRISEISTEAVENFLTEWRKDKGIGNRTHNHYVQAFEQFCSCLTKRLKLKSNPIQSLCRLNNETDVRRKRRALRPDEVGRLITAARRVMNLFNASMGRREF